MEISGLKRDKNIKDFYLWKSIVIFIILNNHIL
nr:MAG TPA: hypothetical protein [Caudoviricetes sp.]